MRTSYFDLRPADTLNVSFFVFLAVITIAFRDVIPVSTVLVAVFAALIAAQIALIKYGRRNIVLSYVYDLFFPFF